MSDMENIKGSALEGSFEVFCPSELLTFHRLISLGVFALVVGIFFACPLVWRFYAGPLSSLVPCLSRGLYEFLILTSLQLQAMFQEVLPLPSEVIVL